MPSVLFVCRANQFRSPLAAALFLKRLGSAHRACEWQVGSAGTWTDPGLPAAPSAVKIAEKLGLPGVKSHLTQQVSQQLLDAYDLILMMEMGQLEAVASEFHTVFGRSMLLSEAADGIPYDIPDPVDSANDADDVVSELRMLIDRGGDKIIKLAETLHEARNIMGEHEA